MLFDNSPATQIWGVSGTTLEPVSLVAKHGERSANWRLCAGSNGIKWERPKLYHPIFDILRWDGLRDNLGQFSWAVL